ncbi:hypothetical protein M407DRAFT_242421 [Tulasnella calospora MUT 4182]|uniref:Uncharacterized protein n=1 Tax=Tulasnella calospora MUT 4182 TaxID=1051891 RepID=A0A0C3QQN6_9AGAM|nr:hypothetical protein M407DRAFT_242421 [Tulasnella calospora MUT 4182]
MTGVREGRDLGTSDNKYYWSWLLIEFDQVIINSRVRSSEERTEHRRFAPYGDNTYSPNLFQRTLLSLLRLLNTCFSSMYLTRSFVRLHEHDIPGGPHL